MTPDVNVLLAASRVDHPHYDVASRWLGEAVVEGGRLRLVLLVDGHQLRFLGQLRVEQCQLGVDLAEICQRVSGQPIQ